MNRGAFEMAVTREEAAVRINLANARTILSSRFSTEEQVRQYHSHVNGLEVCVRRIDQVRRDHQRPRPLWRTILQFNTTPKHLVRRMLEIRAVSDGHYQAIGELLKRTPTAEPDHED